MKDAIKEVLQDENYTIADDIIVFDAVSDKVDYWKNENYNFEIEDYLLEFLENRYGITLEVGAGIGRCTEPLSTISEHIVALEPSLHALKYLKKRNIKNISYVANNDFKLPFKNNSFDLVANITVIEHIPSEYCEQFLLEMKRVLKGSGTLIIRNDAWLYGILEHSGYFDKDPDPTHINMITPRKLKGTLKKLGFNVVGEAYFPYYRYTKIKLPLMDIFSTKGNFVCKIDN